MVGLAQLCHVPFREIEYVPGHQKAVELEAVEAANGLHAGHFHVHGQAALGLPGFHLGAGLPVDGVGGPDTAGNIGRTPFLQQRRHPGRVGKLNIGRGRRIVVGNPLIPVGLGGHHQLPKGGLPVEAPG